MSEIDRYRPSEENTQQGTWNNPDRALPTWRTKVVSRRQLCGTGAKWSGGVLVISLINTFHLETEAHGDAEKIQQTPNIRQVVDAKALVSNKPINPTESENTDLEKANDIIEKNEAFNAKVHQILDERNSPWFKVRDLSLATFGALGLGRFAPTRKQR